MSKVAKIWHIRSNEKKDFVVVNNRLVLNKSGEPKRHRGKIIGTLVLSNGNIGGAVCCPKDTFSKKMGVKVALGRAENNGGVPQKLRKHAKRMANKYEIELELPEPEINNEIDWDSIKIGTKIQARPYEDFEKFYNDFDIYYRQFIENDLEQVVLFSSFENHSEVNDAIDVNGWDVPVQVFKLV